MRFSVLPILSCGLTENLRESLLPCGGRDFYVLANLHCKVSLIFLVLASRISKSRREKMGYINFFEKIKIIFFTGSCQEPDWSYNESNELEASSK